MGNVIRRTEISGCVVYNCNHDNGDTFQITYKIGDNVMQINIPSIFESNQNILDDFQYDLENGEDFMHDVINFGVTNSSGFDDIRISVQRGFLVIGLGSDSVDIKINIKENRKLVLAICQFLNSTRIPTVEYNSHLLLS